MLKILSKGTPDYSDTKLTTIPAMDFIKMFMRNQVLHVVNGPKIVGFYLNSLLYGVLFVLFSQKE